MPNTGTIGLMVERARAVLGRQTREQMDAARARVRQYVRAFRFAVQIEGQHYGGLSNQALYDVREREGRPFLKDSKSLRRHVLDELMLAMDSVDRPFRDDEIRSLMRGIIRDWTVRRVTGEVRDVRIRALTTRYAKAKIKAGYAGRPVGVRTGAWLEALKRAEVYIELPRAA